MSFSSRPSPSQSTTAFLRYTFIAGTGVLLVSALMMFGIEASYDPGEIIDGSNSVLNPDGGTYMSNQSGDVAWSITSNEYTQFETVTDIGGANQPWTYMENANTEPTGLEDPNDTQAGGGCVNTDIVTDADGGFDYAYYAVIDPDGTADNGDEILAFALRISDQVSGAFTFSMLLDADNDMGSDPNAVCGNPGFEYEIQISTQSNAVNVYNIDGCAGISDCDLLQGGDATICEPCNTGAIQVAAGSSGCTASNLDPVFWMGHVNFSDLAGVNSTDDFRITYATTTSPNTVIYKGTNVADISGIGDPDEISPGCDCAAVCAGSGCADCEKDCALACASANRAVLPVEWLDLSARDESGLIRLEWTTAMEINNDVFEIQRYEEEMGFVAVGTVDGAGASDIPVSYEFSIPGREVPTEYFRIRQVDFDGLSSYSDVLEVAIQEASNQLIAGFDPQQDEIFWKWDGSNSQSSILKVMSLNGQVISSQTMLQSNGAIPADRLPSGIYMIQMINQENGKRFTRKVKVLH